MILKHEGVHILEGMGAFGDCGADTGGEIELVPKTIHIGSAHWFHSCLTFCGFALPMLNILDTFSGFIDLGIGEHDWKNAAMECPIGQNLDQLKHAAIRLEINGTDLRKEKGV